MGIQVVQAVEPRALCCSHESTGHDLTSTFTASREIVDVSVEQTFVATRMNG